MRGDQNGFAESSQFPDNLGDDDVALDVNAVKGFIENQAIVLLQENAHQCELFLHTGGVIAGVFV